MGGVTRLSAERDELAAGARPGYCGANSGPAGAGRATEETGGPPRFEPLDDVEPVEPSRAGGEPCGGETDGSPTLGRTAAGAAGAAGTPTDGLATPTGAGAVGTTMNFAGGRTPLAGVGTWPARAGGGPFRGCGPVGRTGVPVGLGPVAELTLLGPLRPPRVGAGAFRSDADGSPTLSPITAGRATGGAVPGEPFTTGAKSERSITGNRGTADEGTSESERDGNEIPRVLVEEIVTDGRAMA